MAQQEREGGVSLLGTKDPILVLNPSQVSHENYLRDCAERINYERISILKNQFIPSAGVSVMVTDDTDKSKVSQHV